MENIEKIIKEERIIGSGEEGTVYKIDDNRVLKLYKNVILNEFPQIENDVDTFIKFKNNSFIFPEEKVYIQGKFGYIQKYIKGVSIDKVDNINELIISYKKLYLDVVILSDNRILTSDLNSNNIIYDNQFRFIDTVDYRKYKKINTYKVLNENIKNINECLLSGLFNEEEINKLKTFNFENTILKFICNDLLNNESLLFDSFLEEIKDSYKVEKLSQFKSLLKN